MEVRIDRATAAKDDAGEPDVAMRRLFGFSSSSNSQGGGSSGMGGGGAGAGGSGDDGESQMVQMIKFHAQAVKYFQQIQQFAAENYGLHVPDLDEAMKGVDASKLVQCGMQAAMNADPVGAMQCSMQFWTIAMQVMQNIYSSIGPLTTTTQQTQFASFDSLMK